MINDTHIVTYQAMLKRCRDQFLFYAEQHRAKQTPEADGKAIVNERFAADIQKVLDA